MQKGKGGRGGGNSMSALAVMSSLAVGGRKVTACKTSEERASSTALM